MIFSCVHCLLIESFDCLVSGPDVLMCVRFLFYFSDCIVVLFLASVVV